MSFSRPASSHGGSGDPSVVRMIALQMGQSSGSAADRGETKGGHLVPAQASTPVRRPEGRRWPWVIVIIAGAVVKGAALSTLFHHRASWISLFAATSVISLLRGRPLLLAIFAAPLIAVALAPHPLLLGIGVGVGALFVLIGLFAAIGTVLRIGDARK
jgi:hypothetical protein